MYGLGPDEVLPPHDPSQLAAKSPQAPRVPVGRTGAPESTVRELTVDAVLRAVRRHLVMVIAVAAVAAMAGLLAFQGPALFRATAVLRLAGERRALSAGVEEATPTLDRTTGPLLSLIPRIRSRMVIGSVVDSLGLRLRIVPKFSVWAAVKPAPPVGLELQNVRVDSNATSDTLNLRFNRDFVHIRWEGRVRRARYGEPLQLGHVRFTVAKRPAVARVGLAVISRDDAIDQVLAGLAVVPVQGTDVLEVRYTDPEPSRAHAVPNLVVQTFYARAISASQERARRRRLFLAAQLEETDRMLTSVQSRLNAFRSRMELASTSDKLVAEQTALTTLDARRGEVEANRRVYQSLLSQLEHADDSVRSRALRTLAYSPEIASDAIVGRLYQQLLTYRTRLDSLTSGPWRSSPQHPDVVQLRSLLRSTQGELVEAVRAQIQSLDDRTTALAELRRINATTVRKLPAMQAEEMRLAQQVTALSNLGDQLRLEHQKSRMLEALSAADIDIVDLANVPDRPLGVPWWLRVGMALLPGLVLGMAGAMVSEARNRAIREPEELERVLPVRGLGVIPRFAEAAAGADTLAGLRQRLDGSRSRALPPSVGVEAFRLLYSGLVFGWNDRPRTILITSVAPRDGKTFIAANLGATFAREGARVLLIDGDLRRPRLHQLFRVSRSPGLTELLGAKGGPISPQTPAPYVGGLERFSSMLPDRAAAAEPASELPNQGSASGHHGAADVSVGALASASIRPTGVEGLYLLPCGARIANPADALKAGGVRHLLRELSGEFDLIIIDTPPVLVSADAPLLARLADNVIMVVRAGQTDRDEAERAYQQLTAAGADVVGTVLNDPSGDLSREWKLYCQYDYTRAGAKAEPYRATPRRRTARVI